jgi:hypothetical protein
VERPRPAARPGPAQDGWGRLGKPGAAPSPGSPESRHAVGGSPGPAASPRVSAAAAPTGPSAPSGSGSAPVGGARSGPASPAGAGPTAGAPAPARPAAAGGLSEDRVRQLHAELVAAKRKLNQGENVSMDSLAKSLRDTESKLRSQHQGRSIDFQIVLKDGKPVVKPVVRK